ncbi:hypothetical protein NA57DRAFT_81198 [Rhizodiscina lignyota]|uniref:Uncharacterized protein n=1 Tax=Rhizodiscina lignyota TaxID=1504668 RepID=A0A9P4I296_9PEZI|nr:hypothetical protein NA57DRAFT_81198 [Rhizodiscina lignyota]
MSSKCYFPDKTPALEHTPCPIVDGEDAAPCCGPGRACLSNRLCGSPQGNADQAMLSRGSCTDASWNSWNCPRYCMGDNNSGSGVVQCTNDTLPLYCCVDTATYGSISGCCNDTANLFIVREEANDPKPASNAYSTLSAAKSGSTITATPMSPNTASHGLSSGAQIGLGVGLGVGLSLLICILGLVLQRRYFMARHKDPSVTVWDGMRYGQAAKQSKKQIAELPSDCMRVELKSERDDVELPSTSDESFPSPFGNPARQETRGYPAQNTAQIEGPTVPGTAIHMESVGRGRGATQGSYELPSGWI